MEQPGPKFVAAFLRSVAVLALEADAQTAWLGKKGFPLLDELALKLTTVSGWYQPSLNEAG
ncbi:hypothetical protein AB0F81_14515 [Actinoplanes sp. NPDC024001]|uniref:hypothetical protein n=1 Tax=Actinoplanes sp. NPDC024001 TaxID=3154598 RepID=UPI0033E3B070